MKPDLQLDGKRLDLGKRIGKGGEGEVYLAAGDAKAAKVYTLKETTAREAKVRAMVRHNLAAGFPLVSFPEGVLTERSGRFAGFTMRVFSGYRQLHELYGVKSRKINFPKADFRFLVRTAANVARAVAQVHASNCVIGDVNHSGILVSSDATVALIDADSFQFEADGQFYACLVGVPEFTPPELQGKSLTGVRRTREHDRFGLAVAIFQLLFMGRHPYAGRNAGADLTLDQLIARNLFAYARTPIGGVSPPVAVATLADMPEEIAEAFEGAFGPNPSQRPTASDWIERLGRLEGRLSRCASDPMHFYPSAAKGCPWCRMEASSGAVLFAPSYALDSQRTVGVGAFDLEKAWAAIKAIALPGGQAVKPRLPTLPSEPSPEAKADKSRLVRNRYIAAGIAGAALLAWVSVPDVAIVWLGVMIGALIFYNRKPFDAAMWRAHFTDIDRRWDEGLARWRERLGIDAATKLRSDLETAVGAYRGLDQAKAQALGRLKTDRRNRQLHEYLDRFLIARASIPGIGPAKTMTLASYGIESAADVRHNDVVNVPGFGDATAYKLVAWRRGVEGRFVYNPNPLPADAAAQAKVEQEFAARRQSLANQIGGGQQELAQIASQLNQRLNIADATLGPLAIRKAQLEADLAHLGIEKPIKPSRWPISAPVVSSPAPTPRYAPPPARTAPIGMKCPICGSNMVRRTARRGRNPGRTFWGCSRYPSCTGTRN